MAQKFGSLGIAGMPVLGSGGSSGGGGSVPAPPSGGGGGSTPGLGAASAGGVFYIDSADATLPNAIVYTGPVVFQTTAPTDVRYIWGNTTTNPVSFYAYDSAASPPTWVPVSTPNTVAAFSLLTATATVPAINSTFVVAVANGTYFTPGQPVAVVDSIYNQVTGLVESVSGNNVTVLALAATTGAVSGYAFTMAHSAALSITGIAGGSGATGPAGGTGPAGAAGQGFTYRGAWAASTAYNAYDVLTYSGSTYIVTTAYTSGSSFDATDLSLWAVQGGTGAAGTRGASWWVSNTTPDIATFTGTVLLGDWYLDDATWDIYNYQSSGGSLSWVHEGNIKGANGQGFNFRGAWAASTAYAPYDVVTYSGSTYIATTSFTSGSTFNAANWSVLAAAAASYTLPVATASALGGVKVGTGLAVAGDGTISSSAPALPTDYISGLQLSYLGSGSGYGSVQVGTGSAWVPGGGSGALVTVNTALVWTPSSALTANAFTYLYLSSAGALVTSATAPALYQGTAGKDTSGDRYLGCVRSNASGQITNFLRVGNRQWYRDNTSNAPYSITGSGSASAPNSMSLSALVPPTSVLALIHIINKSVHTVWIGSSDGYVPTTSGGQEHLVGVDSAGFIQWQELDSELMLNPSQAFQYLLDTTDTSYPPTFQVRGFYEDR